MKTPKQVVISTFGGARPLARLLGLSHGAVWKWRTIPSKYHEKLLALARSKRKRLTPEMLILGASK